MGQPKESLLFEGESLLVRTIRIVSTVSDPIIVAHRKGQSLPSIPPNVVTVTDAIPSAGPLAGIAAGMEALQGHCDAALVVACDQPLLRTAFLAKLLSLIGTHQACLLTHQGRLHPLCAIYSLTLLNQVHHLLRMGERRAAALPESCDARILSAKDFADVDPTLQSLRNINDLPQWRELQGHQSDT